MSFQTKCPAMLLFSQMSKQWMFLVLHEIYMGENKFSGIKRSLKGISGRTLSMRLKELVLLDLIERVVVSEKPEKIEYIVTPFGKKLGDGLIKMNSEVFGD